MLKAESSIVNTYMNVKNEYRRNSFLFLFSDSAVMSTVTRNKFSETAHIPLMGQGVP